MKKENILNVSCNFLKAVLVFLVFFWAVTPVVQAAVIVVTTTGDNVPGSLRAAITTANSNGEDDVINLPAGTYILNGAAGDDANIGGDLDINTSHTITIIGAGVQTTFIDGNQLDRVLHILEGTVSISGVTIQKGKTPNGQNQGEDGEDGGGIYNCGDLTLTNCSIENNTCGRGHDGAVGLTNTICPGSGGYGGGIYNTGSLTLTGCTIKNNAAGDCGGAVDQCAVPHGGHGGGIYNSSTANQVLKNCIISNNTSGNGYEGGWDHDVDNNGGDGGGIYNEGTQTLISCTVKLNTTGFAGSGTYSGGDEGRSGHGGGIYNSGLSTIKKTFINFNATGNKEGPYSDWDLGGEGGGIYNSGTLNLTNCTISNNNTGDSGNGGGIYHYLGILTLSKCSIYNNNTGNGLERENGGSGAGIFNNDTAFLTNCTVSNNNTGNGGNSDWASGGNGGSGGGIYSQGTLTLTNCTICNNSTGSGGKTGDDDPEDKDGEPGDGGGIYNNNQTINIKNTIIANNQVPEGAEGTDCWGNLNSQGYNLIEDTSQCNISGILTGNIIGVDPLLEPLANNGGYTPTHALLPGSPAIDAGNSSGISQDQRGFTRPVDIPGIPNASDGSDIGAYECASTFVMYSISGKITYNETGLAGVTLTFSNSGGTTSTDENGNYSHTVFYGWSGTVTPAKAGYTFTPSSRTYANVTAHQTNQDYTAAPIIPPQISLNRHQLYFGADTAGHQTGSQCFLISNSGGGVLNWTVNHDAEWLNCTPTSGSNGGLITVTVEVSGLSPGTHAGTITVEDPNAVNSPQTVTVELTLYDPGTTNLPFGCFDTPIDGATVMSSIPVTGWVIDDIGIDYVKIYRKAIAGEGSGLVFIGDAVQVEGARPDIEAAYPGYPGNYKAGWGYMLLTNALPNQGNGTFTIYAKAADKEGNIATLGTKTIKCDNINAIKPFGALDTPPQGGLASGSNYVNFGWALTPLPNTIPTDGSTITVWVDGMALGHPVYNRYREDIAAMFPGYNNSAGAGGHFYLDTTQYENGVHTIQWTVTDNAGNSDGIGSRYFTIHNSAGSAGSTAQSAERQWQDYPTWLPADISTIPGNDSSPVGIIIGYKQNIRPREIHPDENGMITIEINQLERLEIHFFPSTLNIEPGTLNISSLPIGSTFDPIKGIFSWLPGPAFLGDFEFVFIKRSHSGSMRQIPVTIRIKPEFAEK